MVRQHPFYLCSILLLLVFAQSQVSDSLWCKNHIVKGVTTSQKVVALTFDDGPHYKTTAKILEVLREKHVRATFFILGENAKNSPQLLAQELADGHEIGNHSYSHRHLNHLSKATITEEISKAEKEIMAIAPKPAIFRPPGGLFNRTVLEAAQEQGYTTILWTIDPHDWTRPPTQQVIDQTLSHAKPGNIVLMHDGQYPLPTPEALVAIIDKLQQQGYEFVTVTELLQYSEINEARPSITFLDW